jgi:cellobiose phosphorylase
VALSQGILGIKPDYRGLVVDPCIARAWKGFRATRKFRGAEYRIEVKNPKGVCKGVASVKVDGAPVAPVAGTALLPLSPAGATHEVEIELG